MKGYSAASAIFFPRKNPFIFKYPGKIPYHNKERTKTMNLTEKAAYIKGLMEGMNFDTGTNEGKLIKNIVELLEDLSLSVLDLEDENALLGNYIDEIDESLGEVEEEVFGYENERGPYDDDYDDDDECDDDCDCCDDLEDDCGCEGDCCSCGEGDA